MSNYDTQDAPGRPHNIQEAPYPVELEKLVHQLNYRPGWHFYLKQEDRGQGSAGLTFEVLSLGYDTYHPDRGETYSVIHFFPVPPASYNAASWKRWLLDRLIEVETHEACEFLRFVEIDPENPKVERPFAPNHGPGWDPYAIRELNTVEAAETTFRGERREGSQSA